MAIDINLDTQVKGSRPPYFGVDSGAANAYVVTTTAPLGPSVRVGSQIAFFALHANTGASTVAVDGGSAITLKKWTSGSLADLASGDIAAGQLVKATYDGTYFQIASAGSGGGGVPGGTNHEVQINSSGVFAGVPTGTAGQVLTSGGASADPSFQSLPLVIGFVMNNGAVGNNVGPMLTAPRAGSFSKAIIITKSSDPSIQLKFRIKQNGVDIFSTDPTVTAGTASGTVSSSTSLTSNPLPVASADVFQIDILTGSPAWQFTVELET